MSRRISWSELKVIAESPAHFKDNFDNPKEPTRPMRIGTIVHCIVLGGELNVYPGRRQGKAWEEYQATHTDIVTQAEVDEATPIAAAVLASPLARAILDGARYETPLEWVVNDVPIRTRGVDIIKGTLIADLKTARSTKPERFMYEAVSMHYDAQLAWYLDGCKQNGIEVDSAAIIGVCTARPYPVVVLELTPALIEQGRQKNAAWIETYKSCAAIDQWPSYCQSPLTLDVKEVELTGFDEDDDEDEALTFGQ